MVIKATQQKIYHSLTNKSYDECLIIFNEWGNTQELHSGLFMVKGNRYAL
jgi:hypothetical protein